MSSPTEHQSTPDPDDLALEDQTRGTFEQLLVELALRPIGERRALAYFCHVLLVVAQGEAFPDQDRGENVSVTVSKPINPDRIRLINLPCPECGR